MRQTLTAQLNSLCFAIILVVLGLTPLLFTPYTTDFFDTSKVIFLAVSVLLLFLLTAFGWVLRGKVIYTKTPLDLPLLFLLIVVLLSTVFSDSRYVSIYGNFPKIHGSAVTWVAYILFYFAAVSHLKSVSQIRTALYTLVGSATIVSVITLLSYFGVYLPINFAKAANFTPTGSTFSTAALLLLLLPVTMINFIQSKNGPIAMASAVLSSLFIVTIILIGGNTSNGAGVLFSPIYIALYVTIFLVVYFFRKTSLNRALALLAIPVALSAIVLMLGYAPFSQNSALYQKRVNFPREIQLDFGTSWKVASSIISNTPLLGTGPATFLFNFSNHKPIEFNQTNYWLISFDTAFNEFLQIFGSLGLLGLLAFLYFAAMVVSLGLHGTRSTDHSLDKSLSVSAIVIVLLLLVHVSSPIFWVASIALLAMLMGAHKSYGKAEELSIGIKASKLTDDNLIVGDVLPILLFIPIMAFIIWTSWMMWLAVAADVNHRQALDSVSKSGLTTYNLLRNAETLNPYIDVYHTDLAQTNFALANALAAAKGPSQASAAGTLTDDDKRTIQTLLSQSIAEARFAVALSPRNPQNWEILASIYRQISGIANNALDFSLDAYGHAIQQDPLNPVLRLNVGGIYYSIKNYELASRFFTDAANLKPDYANAYYNLSITLRDKGDLKNALAVAQQTVSILQQNSQGPDYKTASAYLADLQSRVATNSAQQSPITAPAAAANSSLENKNFPQVNVPELNGAPQVATPAAVKNNPNAKVPQASPSPYTAAPAQQP
jgi:tetratricopeptide (TPR) repeat protein/O-antigen ligase